MVFVAFEDVKWSSLTAPARSTNSTVQHSPVLNTNTWLEIGVALMDALACGHVPACSSRNTNTWLEIGVALGMGVALGCGRMLRARNVKMYV